MVVITEDASVSTDMNLDELEMASKAGGRGLVRTEEGNACLRKRH